MTPLALIPEKAGPAIRYSSPEQKALDALYVESCRHWPECCCLACTVVRATWEHLAAMPKGSRPRWIEHSPFSILEVP